MPRHEAKTMAMACAFDCQASAREIEAVRQAFAGDFHPNRVAVGSAAYPRYYSHE